MKPKPNKPKREWEIELDDLWFELSNEREWAWEPARDKLKQFISQLLGKHTLEVIGEDEPIPKTLDEAMEKWDDIKVRNNLRAKQRAKLNQTEEEK